MEFSEIKPGQYLFYTERPYSNYADSLCKVVEVNGVLYPEWICVNNRGTYVSEQSDGEGSWEALKDFSGEGLGFPLDRLSIKEGFENKCWHPTNYDGKEDPAEFMEREYRLDSHYLPKFQKREIWEFINSYVDVCGGDFLSEKESYEKRRLKEQLNHLFFGSYET